MTLPLVLAIMGIFCIGVLVPLVPYVFSGERHLGIPRLGRTGKNGFRALFLVVGTGFIGAGLWLAWI